VPVRVSSKAWNQGAAWQTVPDWQARGSTGTATRVTTDPRSVAGSRKNKHGPLCRESVSGKNGPLVAAPVPLGHGAAFPCGLLPRTVIQVDSFRESACQNEVTAPDATGAVAIWGGNGSQPPRREGLPGREACRHESYSRYRSAGTIVIRRMSTDPVQEAHGISAN